MEYLLYNRRSYKTGRALATQLGLKSAKDHKELLRIGKPPKIRYGNSFGDFGKIDTTMNSPDVIKLCANSYHFSRWCQEHGFLTPVYRKFDGINVPPFPFLLRKLHHRAGKDIIVIRNSDDLRKIPANKLKGRYWVPFYETTFELRVHIIDGEIVRVFKKIKKGALDEGEFIRTARKDWKYSLRTNLDEKYTVAQNLCVNLAEQIGLFFGGIDIAWDNINREYIIWEVNTAPGLNSVTLKTYADHLRRFM